MTDTKPSNDGSRRPFHLPAIRIRGYRPFRDVLFQFNHLELIIGANGTGKSSLFNFLKLLREGCQSELPKVPRRWFGGDIFHRPGPNQQIFWNLQIQPETESPIFYQGEFSRKEHEATVHFERIFTKPSQQGDGSDGFTYLDFRDGKGLVRDPSDGDFLRKEWRLSKANQLGLGAMNDEGLHTLSRIKRYILAWRFISGSTIDYARMRRPSPLHEGESIQEDIGNLSSILYHIQDHAPDVFDDLKSLIRFAIPGFRGLVCQRRADSDEVYTTWQEEGVDRELTFEDLSEGTLRFIAYATLCITPDPPPLLCIDNVEQGLHPRTLPILAGLFEKAAEKTQVLLTTYDSYFMTQFDVENISIIKKTGGSSAFINVRNSQPLMNELKSNSSDEIEQMYRADELEVILK